MAGTKVRGITIELSADATGISNGLKSANSAISSTGRELKDINKLLKLDPTNVTLLAQKHEALQRQISNTRDKLDILKKAEEDLKAQMVDGGTDEQKRQLEALQREIISTEKDLEKYENQLNDTESETKDLTRAEQQAEQATGKMKEGFTVLKGALANLVADGLRKAAEGFKDLMTAGPAFADEILTLSSTTSLATDTLQELSYMSGLVDVDVSTVASSLKKLTKNMDSARGGTGAAADAFATLGVSVTDINGSLRDNEDVFYDTIDALGKMENETERDALAMAIFGKSATDLNPMIEAGSKQLKAFADEAHEMGYVLDGDALKALGRVQDEFDRFGKQMESVKNQIASGVAPAIERGMKKLSDVVKKIDWKKVGEQMGNAFNKLIDALDWIVQNGAMVKSLLTGIVSAMAAQKVMQFVSGIASMTTALKTATTAQQGLNAAANANPYILLATAIIGVTSALVSYGKSLLEANYNASAHVQAAHELIDATEEVIATIQEQTEAYAESKKVREETINAGAAEMAHVQSLSKELQGLADANGVVSDADKARAQFILGELNNALGTEYTMTGNQITQYQNLTSAIDALIQKKQAEIILSAQEEAYREAITGREQAELALADAVSKRIDYENQLAEYNQRELELTAALESSGQYNGAFVTELGNITSAKTELIAEMERLDAEYQNQANLVDQYAYDVTTYEDNMTKALMGDYDQISYKSWETAKQQGQATSQASQQVITNATTAKNGWMNNLSQMLSETTGMNVEFKDAGNGMVQAYVDGEKRGEAAPANQVKAMGQKMHTQMVHIKTTMQNDGTYAAQGVGTGINSGSGYAYGAMSSFASGLASTFRSLFKISSPSKLMAEYGGFVVEGFAEGVDDNEKIALKQIGKFASDIEGAFNPSLSSKFNYQGIATGYGAADTANNRAAYGADQTFSLLSRYLPALANMKIVLQNNKLVGELAPDINRELGRLQAADARGM